MAGTEMFTQRNSTDYVRHTIATDLYTGPSLAPTSPLDPFDAVDRLLPWIFLGAFTFLFFATLGLRFFLSTPQHYFGPEYSSIEDAEPLLGGETWQLQEEELRDLQTSGRLFSDEYAADSDAIVSNISATI